MWLLALLILLWALPVLAQPTSPPAPRVELFSPQGTIKGVRQVAVRFSAPMVTFGDPRLPEPFQKADLLYIRFDEERHQVMNRRVTEDVVLDIEDDDKIIGIGILDASKHINLAKILPIYYDSTLAIFPPHPHPPLPGEGVNCLI
jgi:uncharacterized protein YuzE